MDGALLFFDFQHPCWTKRMAGLAGEDPDKLETLFERGFLDREEDVYFLTDEGVESFQRAAQESFLPLPPGIPEKAADKRRMANRTLLQLLLDKRHLQRWGLKEYRAPFRFDLPDLERKDLFIVEEEILVWRYPENLVFKAMERDFPVVGLAARKIAPPLPERAAAWIAENSPRRRTMEADLLYKSRYDFQAYAHFPQLPCDPCGLLNTDRFFCFFAPAPEPRNRNALLTTLGEFHMFLTMMRRMYMPGYVDLDSLDQDGINWILYVYEHEEEALKCVDLLSPFRQDLAGPAAPLEVWSLSLGALWNWSEPADSIHDLLPLAAHPIWRNP
jgi:hypothetical protein